MTAYERPYQSIRTTDVDLEGHEQRTVQTARCTEVGVLYHGALTQPGVTEPSGETLVVARGGLAVEQQAEPVLAREVGGGGVALHLEERIGHGPAG